MLPVSTTVCCHWRDLGLPDSLRTDTVEFCHIGLFTEELLKGERQHARSPEKLGKLPSIPLEESIDLKPQMRLNSHLPVTLD
jgi:hypothetical protein